MVVYLRLVSSPSSQTEVSEWLLAVSHQTYTHRRIKGESKRGEEGRREGRRGEGRRGGEREEGREEEEGRRGEGEGRSEALGLVRTMFPIELQVAPSSRVPCILP